MTTLTSSSAASLAGKTILLTAAAQGIGRASALACLAAGADVIATDVQLEGLETLVAEAAAGAPLIVFDVPLLVESGRWRPRVARVLVIDCSTETQFARVLQRPGWTHERIEGALAAQASRQTRRAAADAVLWNDGIALVTLRNQVLMLAARWGCETIAAP